MHGCSCLSAKLVPFVWFGAAPLFMSFACVRLRGHLSGCPTPRIIKFGCSWLCGKNEVDGCFLSYCNTCISSCATPLSMKWCVPGTNKTTERYANECATIYANKTADGYTNMVYKICDGCPTNKAIQKLNRGTIYTRNRGMLYK